MSNGEILGFAFKVEKQGDEQYYAMVEAEYSFGYVPISSEPTASIVSPQNGSTVSGSVTTSVAASSAYPIQNILYYRNGLLSDMKFTAPYDSLWNTTKYPNGTYTLGVRAKDLIGARRYTPYTQVTVSNGGDTTPPVTSITSPTAGSQMPQIATVSVLANDASGVSKVELWKDSILYATDLTAPYTFTWDTTQEVNGTHTLMSKAYDIYGNVGISVGVSVLTQNVTTDSQPPITYISSPTQGVVVSGTTLVQSVASDNVGVTNIELYKNNALISSGAYSYAWNTVGEQNGTYTFQSKAYDAAGNQGISVPVSVTVNNQTTVNDSTPPTVSITNPAYNQVLPRRGSVSVSATAADQSGIATIRVFIDGVLKKTCSLTTTCQYSWSIGKVSSGTHTVSVTAIDNSPNMNSTSASISVIK
jgi:hypothetical protein